MPCSAGPPLTPPPPLLLVVMVVLVTLPSPSCGLVTGHRFLSGQLSSHQQLGSAVLPSRAMCGALCLRRPLCSGVQFTATPGECRLYQTVVGGDGVSPASEGLLLDQEMTTTEPISVQGSTTTVTTTATTTTTTMALATTTIASFQCTMADWEVGYGGQCYFFSSSKTFPNTADQDCRNIHPQARITSVVNDSERTYILSKIGDKIVVGLIRSSPALDDWHWENGDPSIDFRGFFKDGEPKNDDGSRMFTHMLSNTGELVSASSGDDTFFVCKISTS